MKKASVIYSLGLAAATYLMAGCQGVSNSYLSNPNSGLLKREIAQTQLCLDAAYPRTLGLACERLGEHARRIIPDAVDVVARVPAAVAVDPVEGRYFGTQYHDPVLNVDRGYSGSTQNPGRALALHPINWALTATRSVSRLFSDLTGTITHTGNVILQPLNADTSKREEWFSDSRDNNPNADRAKLVYDGATDIVKGPIKTVFYVVDSDKTPDSIKYGVDRMRKWEGYEVGDRKARLEQKLAEDGNKKNLDGVRTAVNSIPIADKPLDEFWGTTRRRDYADKVATTIPDSIPSSQTSDWRWYRHLRGEEQKAPGVIETDSSGNPSFHPNESIFLGVVRGAWTALTSLFHLGGGSSSGGVPDGGVPTGGGTTGWSTGN